MHTLIWDVETKSAISLHDCGSYIYAIDPSTAPLCMAFAIDDGDVQLWRSTEPPPAVFLEISANPNGWLLASHNWSFENAILEHCLVPRHGFAPIPLEIQTCTQRLACANAYPAELGLLAEALGLPYRKDPAAKRALLQVSRPKQQRKRKPGASLVWDEDPAKLALVYERCRLDVITTRAVLASPLLEPLNDNERRHLVQDMAINNRGVRVDRAFATAARDLAFRERTAINLQLERLTLGQITSVNQTARFLSAINAAGCAMASVDKRAVERVLASEPSDYVCQLLKLRQAGARNAFRKFEAMLNWAAPADDRLRQTLRMYGTGTGRWVGTGPQLQNLKRNESGLPLTVVDSIRAGMRSEIAQYGEPLALLGDLLRAALCAAPGMELKSADFSAIESIVLSWLAGEKWKLDAYLAFWATGDLTREPYRVVARKMLHLPDDAEITSEQRQLGKCAELACGFGGSVGAWRRIAGHDSRTDDEIKVIIEQWRAAHPATRKYWNKLSCALRIAIRTGGPILVAPEPAPPIVATFEDGTLRMRLPSGRSIAYPNARLVPGRYEDAAPDIEFHDNEKGQWKPVRGWHGIFAENVASGIARDLLAAAIDRFEQRGFSIVHHCHDEITAELPIGALTDAEFRAILLEAPPWAAGLPLGGKVHSGPHYLPTPDKPALAALPAPELATIEAAIEIYLDEAREDIGPIDDIGLVNRNDDLDFVACLPDDHAPLFDLVSLPMTTSGKVSCPFHDDPTPSCAIYPDHYFCFGCRAHGGRLDWLMKAEGMTEAEALALIKDWTAGPTRRAKTPEDDAETLAYVLKIWRAARPIAGTIGERYLDQTRGVDLTKLPPGIHRALRFHAACPFGSNVAPCLVALMVDPLTDAPRGIQRIALREAPNGRVEKIDRWMLGRAGVCKLWPAGSTLVVGEGLETTLAAATRIHYGSEPLQPAWSAVTKNGLAFLPRIEGVEKLIVLADHDSNREGQRAAEICRMDWLNAGRSVSVITPNTSDFDFNDLVLAEDARARQA
jgi:Toprim domain/CHC2 zinc finger